MATELVPPTVPWRPEAATDPATPPRPQSRPGAEAASAMWQILLPAPVPVMPDHQATHWEPARHDDWPGFTAETWRLLLHGDPEGATQAASLCRFVRRQVLADPPRPAGACVAPDAFGPAAWSAASGTLIAPERLLAFDFASLLRAGPYRKAAILPPPCVPGVLYRDAGADQDPFDLIQAARAALARTSPLVLFDAAQARALALLGAPDATTLRLPALAPSTESGVEPPGRADTPAASVLLIDNLGEADVRERLVASLRGMAAVRSVDVCAGWVGAARDDVATRPVVADTGVHVHLGTVPHAGAPRVIDSLAMRKPVIVFHPLDRRMEETPEAGSAGMIEHLRSGIVASDPVSLQLGIARLLGDPASVATFLRNGDRLVDAWNTAIAGRLREALA